ncbi:hypothetical protein HCN51_55045 [Nonomuraea sp. FMUSA5-5]|uniref:Uncharacterized protein n=1 Tax=Nonomuraea composti TaxID=2720023 RepID=A0ABX1BT62_9ACTN|nr:hypothetical protein [Nonomuraea sp. FMUSA5-5]NJP98448.1 hypothetical protein [Nonomuraea sp. FMUSA5-5]
MDRDPSPAGRRSEMTDYMARYADAALRMIPALAGLSEDHQAIANLARLPAEDLGNAVPALAALYEAVTRPPHDRMPPHGLVFSAIRQMPVPERAYIYIAGVLQEASTTRLAQLAAEVRTLTGTKDDSHASRREASTLRTRTTTQDHAAPSNKPAPPQAGHPAVPVVSARTR